MQGDLFVSEAFLTPPSKLTTPQLLKKLRMKYPSGAYVFLDNVASTTGGGAGRYADAMVMSLWPSRGLSLSGFELKVSRSDWLTEFKNPAKAEEIAQYCDYWWMVTADDSIIKPIELPENWGLLTINAKGDLYPKVKAPKLNPVPMTRAFMGAMFRKATDDVIPRAEIADQLQDAVERGRSNNEYLVTRAKEDLQKLRDAVRVFEEASGVHINEWGDTGNIGRAVNDVLNHKVDEAERRLKSFRKSAENLIRFIDGEKEQY